MEDLFAIMSLFVQLSKQGPLLAIVQSFTWLHCSHWTINNLNAYFAEENSGRLKYEEILSLDSDKSGESGLGK